MKHHHGYKAYLKGAKSFTFRCECKKEYSRPPNKKELKKFLSSAFDMKIHKVWHAFLKKFMKYKEVPVDKKLQGFLRSKTQLVEDGWKYQSYNFMERVRKFAKKYPEDIFVCGIDDSFHASSDLVFVLHRGSPRKNWGTTVLVITQCDGVPPKQYFMYPSHAKGIYETIGKINKLKSRYPV